MPSHGSDRPAIPQTQNPFALRHRKKVTVDEEFGGTPMLEGAPSKMVPQDGYETDRIPGESEREYANRKEAEERFPPVVAESPSERSRRETEEAEIAEAGTPRSARKVSPDEIARQQRAREGVDYFQGEETEDPIERTYLDLMMRGESPVPALVDQMQSLVRRFTFPPTPKALDAPPPTDRAKWAKQYEGLPSNQRVWEWDDVSNRPVEGLGRDVLIAEHRKAVDQARGNFQQQADLIWNQQVAAAKRAAEKADSLAENTVNIGNLRRAMELMKATGDASLTQFNKQAELTDTIINLDRDISITKNEVDAAIKIGNLQELVRSNKKGEELAERKQRAEEELNRQTFLGTMLHNGGLMFFTLAQMDVGAAQSLFKQLTGTEASGTSGPFAAAAGFNEQFGGEGGLRAPSAQEFARQSPLQQMQTRAGFEGQGRDVQAEIAQASPATYATRRRKRAR